MALVKFRIRRDTAANWTTNNPTLALGEPGLETDTRKVKYGDGVTPWTDLHYTAVDRIDWEGIENVPDGLAELEDVESTPFGRGLLELDDAAAARSALNLEIGSDVQAHNANLDAIAGATPIADGPHTVGGITITTVGGIITSIS